MNTRTPSRQVIEKRPANRISGARDIRRFPQAFRTQLLAPQIRRTMAQERIKSLSHETRRITDAANPSNSTFAIAAKSLFPRGLN
jgi:hypothetical protein